MYLPEHSKLFWKTNIDVAKQVGDTTYTKIFVGGLARETERDTLKCYFDGRRANCSIAALGAQKYDPSITDRIVLTYVSLIFGLVHLGVHGIGIPEGKLDMYVAAAGEDLRVREL